MLGKIAYIGAFLVFFSGMLGLAYLAYGRTHRSQCEACSRLPGRLSDYQVMAGGKWTGYWSPDGPSPRYMAALAYDGRHGRYILFGGETANGTSDETWSYSTRWTKLNPAHHPPPRRDAAMAWDATRGLDVLYGGLVPDQAEGTPASDTWTWDGDDWTQVATTSEGPGRREGSRMVAAGDRLLMFGGHYGNLRYFADVWSFDGSGWTRVDRNPTPAGRGDAAVAWDNASDSLFVYGGSGIKAGGGPGESGVPLGDGWLMHDGAWTAIKAPGPQEKGPALLTLANALWDESKQRVMIVNGISCPDVSRATFAWQWNASGWQAAPDWFSHNRWGAAAAEAPNGDILIFGGSDEIGC
jgi:hypothetical protein